MSISECHKRSVAQKDKTFCGETSSTKIEDCTVQLESENMKAFKPLREAAL